MSRQRLVTALLALLLGAGAAGAGPWARSEGEIFLSFGAELSQSRALLMQTGTLDPDTIYALYGEYGIGHRLTFGLDVSEAEASTLRTVFLRRTLTAPGATWQFAADIGAVQYRQTFDEDSTLIRLGGSVGRGFGSEFLAGLLPLPHQGGWFSLDAFALIDTGGTRDPIWKFDGTVGLRLSERWTVTQGAVVEDWGDGIVVSAMPSIVFALGETTSLQLGGTFGVLGSDTVGVSLKLWQTF